MDNPIQSLNETHPAVRMDLSLLPQLSQPYSNETYWLGICPKAIKRNLIKDKFIFVLYK